MDQEMKAQVDEFLQANGRRELSPEEADKAVGGMMVFGCEIRTEEDVQTLCEATKTLEEQFGSGMVADWIREESRDDAIINAYCNNGVAGLYSHLMNLLSLEQIEKTKRRFG